MASAFDTHFEDNALAALQTWHGESFVRWPKGHNGGSVTVTGCLWTPDETATRDADQDGDHIALRGVLQVPASSAPLAGDVWLINDLRYAAVSVSAPHGTLQNVSLQYTDKQTTSRHRDGFY